MCGVFGYIAHKSRGPNIRALRDMAVACETRGNHAFGLAWSDHDHNILRISKLRGGASKHLHEFCKCRKAKILIGHTRFATHGSPEDQRNNHPHYAGAGVIVHNGVVANDEELTQKHMLMRQAACDSEVIGLMFQKAKGKLLQKAEWVANQLEGDFAVLGIWRNPVRMLVMKRGNPLVYSQDDRGVYFASIQPGMPGKPVDMPDNRVNVVTAKDALDVEYKDIPEEIRVFRGWRYYFGNSRTIGAKGMHRSLHDLID